MRDFATLFTGRDDAYGVYTIPTGTIPSQKGKLAGMAVTKHDAVTPELYAAHLRGERRLGIVPIRLDNSTMWIALDADIYKDAKLHADLAQRISQLKLPLCITKSKSGGAHVWLFFRDGVPATAARSIGNELVKKLKLSPTTEIFPKQESIREEDDGSWINLPYFGETCRGLDPSGTQELSLDQFLAYADDRVVSAKDLRLSRQQADELERETDSGSDAPPCVERMLRDGVEEGGRDSGLTQMAVYYSRAYPDEWEGLVMEAGLNHVHPPLEMAAISKIIKSIKSKTYQYLCKQQPMASLCDKPACLKRKFGVGGGVAANVLVIIEAIQKIDGEEPLYIVTMDGGKKFTITAKEIKNYDLFREAALKRLDRLLPGTVTKPNWEDQINRALVDAKKDIAPLDTQTSHRIVSAFKSWCNRAAQSEAAELIEQRRGPYFKDQQIYFVGDHFMNQIDRQFARLTRQQVWVYLREWGVVQTTLGNTEVWLYVVPPGEDWFHPEKRGQVK